MKRRIKTTIYLMGIFLGILLGIENTSGNKAFAEESNQYKVTGTVYDFEGNVVHNASVRVEAVTKVNEYGESIGPSYSSYLDENGKYQLELPNGYYLFYFIYHNRGIGCWYSVNRDCVIDISLTEPFYQVTGKIYLDGELFSNGSLHLVHKVDDPSTGLDDAYITLETDENGEYAFYFPSNIYGDFYVSFYRTGKWYECGESAYIPGVDTSGYDIMFSSTDEEISAYPTVTSYSSTENVDSTPTEAQPTPTEIQPTLTEVEPTSTEQPIPTEAQLTQQHAQKKKSFKKGTIIKKNNIKYRVLSNTSRVKKVTVIGITQKKERVVIPDVVKQDGITFLVTQVSDEAFYQNKTVSYVSFGKNITKIGKKAFYGTSHLKRIVFKTKKVKTIGSKAFIGINNNARIVVPEKRKKRYTSLLEGKY